MESRKYDGVMGSHLKDGSLVASNLQVGTLSRDDDNESVFNPLDLPSDDTPEVTLVHGYP